jgi:hypothetical protein
MRQRVRSDLMEMAVDIREEYVTERALDSLDC